jgi:HEAT repeat protein
MTGSVAPAALLADAGNHTFAALLGEFLESDGRFVERFWEAYGRFHTTSHKVYLDVQQALAAIAQRWPEQFLAGIEATKKLAHDVAVLRVLANIDRAGAREVLYAAVRAESPYSNVRATALESLVRLGDPRLPDLLVEVLGIPEARNAAVIAALDFGDARLLPRLRRIVAARKTPGGRRGQAYDAIVAISTRVGTAVVPDPPPGWRPLVEVPRARAATVAGRRFEFVRAGTPIVEDHASTPAPCDGLIETVEPMLRIRPVEWTPDNFVRELHASAGTRTRHSILLEQLPQLGEDACDAVFEHLRSSTPTAALGSDDPREVAEALGRHLHVAARTWPDRFLANLREVSDLDTDFPEVIAAVAEVDRPEARERLIQTARHPNKYRRALAVDALAHVGDPRLPDLLLEFIKDRSNDVQRAAIRAAIDFGDERLLPALRKLEDSSHPYVLDAIEAISVRAGHLRIPPLQRRLVEVERPDAGGATITVVGVFVATFIPVRAGQDLAEVRIGADPHWITAPVAGTVLTSRARVGHPLPPVPFRLRPS